jgi:N-acetylmuramoyl-L-alanine amidase
VEGRRVDALEALEIYQAVQRRSGEGGCEPAIDRALITAELGGDPAELYRDLHALSEKRMTSRCAERVDRLKRALAAFRPPDHVLGAAADSSRTVRRGGPDEARVSRDAGTSPGAVGPVVVPTVAAGGSRVATITKLEHYGALDAARVVVFLTHPTTFEVGFLPRDDTHGPRHYVDIEHAQYEGTRRFDVGGIVESVRVGTRKQGTRIVLDVQTEVYRKVFYLPEPFRLVVDVARQAPVPVTTADGKRPLRRVVLDPGHGGHDPGAVGPTGLREKDVTLDVAHRAAPIIAQELGVVTLLTRDSDEFVPLDERTARANAFRADLFISIHCNASQDANSRGVMTFVLDESRDLLAAGIAARENAASPAAAAELAMVLSQVLDRRSLETSVHVAQLLQRATLASLSLGYSGVKDHGVRRAGFYVLAGAQMPAVLYELSFISNPLEELRLNTADYRQKLADALANTVRAFSEGM